MLSRTTRASLRRLQRSAAPTANNSSSRPRVVALQQLQTPAQFIQQNKFLSPRRTFHSAPAVHKGITPDSSDPKPPNPQSTNGAHVIEATPLSDKDYHDVSEHYLEVLLAEVERVQEDGSEVEAEFSVSHYSLGLFVVVM
jgi:frataxin